MATWFVPAVLAVVVIAFIIWATVGPEPRLARALIVAVAVVIIACSCALGLAAPVSIMVGVGRGARLGVLIKNAEALELMEKVDIQVVDKTGILTEGRPSDTAIVPAAGSGGAGFLVSLGLDTSALTAEADRLRGDGATAIFRGVDDQVAGIFAIADPVKASTSEALKALRAVAARGTARTTIPRS